MGKVLSFAIGVLVLRVLHSRVPCVVRDASELFKGVSKERNLQLQLRCACIEGDCVLAGEESIEGVFDVTEGPGWAENKPLPADNEKMASPCPKT